MNKEQLELLDDAYENYSKKSESQFIPNFEDGTMTIISPASHYGFLSKEEFINKCKTDSEFFEKWGYKIEERELSLEERHKIALPIWKEQYGPLADMMVPTNVDNTPFKIPTKLITITYNDKTIESYE